MRGGQMVVTVVNFAGKRGVKQGEKWSTRDALFRLGEPAQVEGAGISVHQVMRRRVPSQCEEQESKTWIKV